MVRIYYDLEFIEELDEIISIGMTDDTDRELYLINKEAHFDLASDWVKNNVITLLPPEDDPRWVTKEEMKQKVLHYIGRNKAELWADYGCYDHVFLCRLLADRMVDTPPSIPYTTHDIQTMILLLGVSEDDLPKTETEHDALSDARSVKSKFHYLMNEQL